MALMISGSRMSFCKACSTEATNAAGVPAGAARPYQALTSKSGRPSSASVATAGSALLRCLVVTAKALTAPP